MFKQSVQDVVQQHYDTLVNHGYNVLGVFLYGSQNYEMDYEGSDVDTKAIVIPSIDDVVLNKQPISTTSDMTDDGQCDIKDIRKMFECFKKQNINFVELLFTQYRVINPIYETLYAPMLENREMIARYNNFASINCMVGMMLEKYHALEHPYPSIIDKIERYGYDPKQLHHIMRLWDFMHRYITDEPYEDILTPNDKEYILSLKTTPISLESARNLAKGTVEKAQLFKQCYMEDNEVKVNKNVEILMNQVTSNIIKESFRRELENV